MLYLVHEGWIKMKRFSPPWESMISTIHPDTFITWNLGSCTVKNQFLLSDYSEDGRERPGFLFTDRDSLPSEILPSRALKELPPAMQQEANQTTLWKTWWMMLFRCGEDLPTHNESSPGLLSRRPLKQHQTPLCCKNRSLFATISILWRYGADGGSEETLTVELCSDNVTQFPHWRIWFALITIFVFLLMEEKGNFSSFSCFKAVAHKEPTSTCLLVLHWTPCFSFLPGKDSRPPARRGGDLI